MSLINLYEMARTRGDAMWAVLDWAAQQPGEFTIKDLYKVFTDAGGGSTYQQFHSMVKVAKPWKDDQAKYGVSEKRPFVFARRGAQGGQAHLLQWGLSGPLRTPPVGREPLGQPGTPTGDILDKLEDKMGRPALSAALKRWRGMTDIHRIAADIRATVPGRYQMDALQVGTEHLVQSGKAEPEDVENAEDEVQAAPEQEPATPFKKPTPKAAPTPTPSDDDDEDMGPGWTKIPNEPDEPDEDDQTDAGFADSDVPADTFDEPEDEPTSEPDEREWPVYLPDPDDEGNKYERAMFAIVDSQKIDEHDPVWSRLKSAKNDVDAHQIIKSSRIPKELHRAAVLVAHAIFDNTGRDWETGKKIGESRLLRLYEGSPLLQHVDFEQKSGLSRIYGMNEMDNGEGPVANWQEAERKWPGSGAAWDQVNQGEDIPIELSSIGSLLFATLRGTEDKYLYGSDGTWTGLGRMRIQRMGAFVKLMPGDSSGPAMYIPISKRIPFIQVVGPTPQDLPGFTAATRPNGKVSAEKKNPDGEDIRQAALAVQTFKKAEPSLG